MTKEWYEVRLIGDFEDSTSIDLINDYFFDQGSLGSQIQYAYDYLANQPNLFGEIPEEIPAELLDRPVEIVAYFEAAPDCQKMAAELGQALKGQDFDLKGGKIADENWQTNWQQNYHPLRLSRYLTIVPIWEEYEAMDKEELIYIDPGLAFGTGDHPTTQLGIQALETVLRGDEVVLDVGTGSGILSFVAAVLGARKVYGYDLDPQAVHQAQVNLAYQKEKSDLSIYQADQVIFQENNLLAGVDVKADVIVANILPHILEELYPQAKKLLKEGAYLILGGILLEKGSEVEAALEKAGFEIVQKTALKGWLSYISRLKKED